MKLNLLPTKVSSESGLAGAWITAIIIGLVGVVLAVLMSVKSSGDLADAQSNMNDQMSRAQQANTVSEQADAIMGSENVALLTRNIQLAQAMQAHSKVYPELFNMVRGYIPYFFRLTSLSATPVDANTSTVTMTGTISTYQQYADVMLALWRIPGAISVSRTGYQLNDAYIPALTPQDQTGHPIKPGTQNLPDDPMQRLAAMEANAQPTTYQNVGNFGGDPTLTRGAMPNASLVTIQVTVNKDLQTPDPRATLSSPVVTGSAAAATGTAGAGTGAAINTGGVPGTTPTGAGAAN